MNHIFQRRSALNLFLGFICGGLAFSTTAQTNAPGKVASESASSWVKPQMFARLPPSATLGSGEEQRCLISERQINVASNETFFHVARQIRSYSGVQNGANISVDFKPEFQTLAFHWIRIWRGTNILNRLNLDQVKLIRQERELDNLEMNGTQTAVLLLDDVRVGDIVDCAYTLKGSNPVMEGTFSAQIPVQFSQPMERYLARVICPKDRKLFIRSHGTSAQPKVFASKETTEYLWDLQQVPPANVEDSLPAWFNPYPWIQLSECSSWADVNQWALKLFSTTGTPSPELTQKLAEWRRIQSPEEKILSVLRFVQDEVRYFAVEIGENSHRPIEPATVFQRRYGDCKDKAMLFVTILRTLGIEAYPVLVNTTARQTIEGWLPSPAAFDHCIAQAQCNGRTYWLDTTISYQRGPLANHYLPNFGRGLVITPKTKNLSVIPLSVGSPQTTTTEYYTLGARSEPADFRVVTVAEGRDADVLREYFASTKRSDIEQSYLRYYSPSFRGLRQAQPLTMTDDERQNRIEISEFYTIEQPWTETSQDEISRFTVIPYVISSALKKPTDTRRQMPIGLKFPQHQIWRAEVTLPFYGLPDVKMASVNDSAFSFSKDYRLTGSRVEMECEYQSFTETVPVTRAQEYLNRLNEASEPLGYQILWR